MPLTIAVIDGWSALLCTTQMLSGFSDEDPDPVEEALPLDTGVGVVVEPGASQALSTIMSATSSANGLKQRDIAFPPVGT
jgi:hypothetical protein